MNAVRLPECTRVLLVYSASLVLGALLAALLTGCSLAQLQDTLDKVNRGAAQIEAGAGKVAAGAEDLRGKVSQLDANKDGKVSWWEALAGMGGLAGVGALVDKLANGGKVAASLAQAVGIAQKASGDAVEAKKDAEAAHQRLDRVRTDVDGLYDSTHKPVVVLDPTEGKPGA